MKKLIRKTVTIFALMAIVVSSLPLGTIVASTRPSITVDLTSDNVVEEGSSVSYIVKFYDADDINLSGSYVNLNGFTANISIKGNGDTRTVTLSNIQGSTGRKTISIDASAGKNRNGGTLATPNSDPFTLVEKTSASVPVTLTKDTVRPSVRLGKPSKTSVNVGETVQYVATFQDETGINNINLSRANVQLVGFTATVNVSGSGNTRTITLSNIQGTAGKKYISIKSGAASDAAGNVTLATPNSESFTLKAAATRGSVDVVRPSIRISKPSEKSVNIGGTVSYVVTFEDETGIANISLSNAYITLNGFKANVSVSGKGNAKTVTLSNIQGEVGKKCSISVKSGAANDAAGNITLATPNSDSFTIVKKTNTTPIAPNKGIDNEPNTGVESLPILPIMGGAATVLTAVGFVITKRIYG